MADELRDLVRARRQELRLSYTTVAATSVVEGSDARVSVGWLHRLESGEPINAPSHDALAALAVGLRVEKARLREAAAAQWFDVHLGWQASGEAADIVERLARLPERQRTALVDLIRALPPDATTS